MVKAINHNRFAGNDIKKKETARCAWATMGLVDKIKKPITIEIHWHEKNERRDIDNVAYAIKFILDGLVTSGKLEDDSRKWVRGITHHFPIDRNNPRVVVTITEIESKGEL